ncbi:MAG TPA: helix-turn-helix domain-containing protein [Nitrolancea sp.]|nr:helix-turn-helix domain-containing protein [Nitrolancea sp.]
MTGNDLEAPDAMTIRDLATRSGVPARRIRYYVAEGLLAPPIGQGRAAHYGSSHLFRLRKIRELRQANLGLDEIKQRIGEPEAPDVRRSPASQTWRRWEILPGVELHTRGDLEPEVAELARLFVSLAREALAERLAGGSTRE